jgi:hypothetical protein|tara:strand:+ start:213 stop:515 length:303 start_codon:yes stop_codon:yes gene_type:complete
MIKFSTALMQLKPGAQWNMWNQDYDTIEWLSTDITKPTKEEILAKQAELQAAYDAQEYARKRAKEYPDWQTQLDYIYHNGIDKWKTDIVDPVKTKYPKPS